MTVVAATTTCRMLDSPVAPPKHPCIQRKENRPVVRVHPIDHDPTRRRTAARARDLVPLLAEHEAATKAARDVPAATVAAFHDAGLLRVLQPRRFGGLQQPFDVFSRIVETLAEGCAASAWVYAVLAEHQWIIASLPEQGQIDVWGEIRGGGVVIAGAARNRETCDGGWRLSGRFPFSSGCTHSQWAIIGARCEDAAGNGRPAICWCRCGRSRSSTTGTCSACAAPAAAR